MLIEIREGLSTGKLKHSKDKVEYTILISNPIKSLEICLGHDSIECEKLHWENQLSKWIAYFYHGRNDISQSTNHSALIIPFLTFIVNSCVIPENTKKR
jgi:hypothetical protein